MELQINQYFVESNTTIKFGNIELMATPPLDGEYWLFRVTVSDKQAIIGFPKFGTIGIGFQVEEDWNTNLPYSCDTKEIFTHISHNKGDDGIPDEACIAAIKAIQAAAAQLMESVGK